MTNPAEQRSRFEHLLQHSGISTDIIDRFFADGFIDKVECSRSNRSWTFYIRKKSLVPSDVYLSFCRQIQDKFHHIAQTRFVLRYDSSLSDNELVMEYWPLFIDWLAKNNVSVNGWLSHAKPECANGECSVTLPGQIALELARKKNIDQWIQRFFSDFFSRSYRIAFNVDQEGQEYEKFKEQVDRENQDLAWQIIASAPQVEEKTGERVSRPIYGYPIDDQPVPIQNVTEEERKIVLQGRVFELDARPLKTGKTLYIFNITDFTDSLQIKCFSRDKEDVKQLSRLSNGMWVKVRGSVQFDTFSKELAMFATDVNEVLDRPVREDQAAEKRVEFHVHTAMSAMDAIAPVSHLIKQAAQWGHKAIAVTDHNVVQSFPEAYAASKKYGIKMIYGVEANVVNDSIPIVLMPREQSLDDAVYVIFDVETTGLSVANHKIIELAGVKMQNGKVIDRFESFINPHQKIPRNIIELTNITDDMVENAPEIDEVIRKFIHFIGDSVLAAHNARFDIGFLQAACRQQGLPPITNPAVDTLELARFLYPSMKNHRLNTLADKFKVKLESHHRAVDDSEATGHILFHLIRETLARDIDNLARLNDYVGIDLQNVRPFHCNIYAKDETGKKNLYKLISLAHTVYLHKEPRIPRSALNDYREGLIITSGCDKGELFETVLNKSFEEAESVAAFYDVLEIQPHLFHMHLVDKQLVDSEERLIEVNQKIIRLGEQLGKPVIATGNVHYLDPEEKLYREILIHGITGFSPLKDQRKPDAHFRTTDEMLAHFPYLSADKAYEIVVRNTNDLADQFEELQIVPDKLYTPKIEGADDEIREMSYRRARQIYGEPLPEIVEKRLEKELNSIITNGFSVIYLIAHKLVKKSLDDGYLVGSRGSVGSSFVATMTGITEVNPLSPHYVCPGCQYSEWFMKGEYGSGYDLPDHDCPRCGTKMTGDGQDIPFETFLGFKGDKVPDIDLNFSGEYQPVAHNYTKELFGEEYVFRAGTIGTVAEKTAFGFVKKYEESKAKTWRNAEVQRLAAGCTGAKRTTGQHPGGIIVVPDYMEIYDFCPVQFPADDKTSEWKTTHFDFHSIHDNLLKLDILGHDDPTMMRMLHDLTGVDPRSIPLNDPQTMSIFNSTEALGVQPEQIRTPMATYGIPEMGTKFVRQMLEDTKPTTFAELVQISGLSHGTDVWLNNAQDLVRSKTAVLKEVIGCRDDIMVYLIYKGLEFSLAFKIMESVRKGKGLNEEWIAEMKKHGVPQWYIESCQKIKYMFPKAHAAAYVLSAVRTAYYKVYHPIEFYAAYFSVRADDFDVELCSKGYDSILAKINEIEQKGITAAPKEKSLATILDMALEMTARGFKFKTVDLYRSAAARFTVDGDSLIPPFSAVQGIGANAAKAIAEARDGGEFLSLEDFQHRTRVSKTIVELLQQLGCFRGLPESNQLSLF